MGSGVEASARPTCTQHATRNHTPLLNNFKLALRDRPAADHCKRFPLPPPDARPPWVRTGTASTSCASGPIPSRPLGRRWLASSTLADGQYPPLSLAVQPSEWPDTFAPCFPQQPVRAKTLDT
jgi:hypothetical protein